jgi:hypothetical protein
MPWRCPACRTVIHHNPLEDRPRSGEIYRCHVCRLSLEFHSATDKLIVAPLGFDNDDEREHRTDRDGRKTQPARRLRKPQQK